MAKRTTVTMLQAGPEGAAFGIFRARVRNPAARWTWDIHRAVHVATVHVGARDRRPSYREMAEAFATKDWPALEYPAESRRRRRACEIAILVDRLD